MPKKRSRVVQYHRDNKKRRMRRTLRERLKRLSRKEFNFRTCLDSDPDDWEDENCEPANFSLRRKIFGRREVQNVLQKMQYPLNTNCIFTLYGMISIDENALRNQRKDQSLIKSLFNFYSLHQVQVNPDYLILRIHKNRDNIYPISYIVERFRSHGQRQFFQIAQKIDGIREVFERATFTPKFTLVSDKLIEKYAQEVKGKRVMVRIAPNCLIFTKELLEIGGYSVNDIGNECLTYRSFVSDIFLAEDYRGQVNKFFELYNLGVKFRQGEINQTDYTERSKQIDQQYIVHKNNSCIKVMTSKYNLAPGIGCWEVLKVIGEEPIIISQRELAKYKRFYSDQQEKKHIATLSHLTKIPKNMTKDYQKMICSYRAIGENQLYK